MEEESNIPADIERLEFFSVALGENECEDAARDRDIYTTDRRRETLRARQKEPFTVASRRCFFE